MHLNTCTSQFSDSGKCHFIIVLNSRAESLEISILLDYCMTKTGGMTRDHEGGRLGEGRKKKKKQKTTLKELPSYLIILFIGRWTPQENR